jgi:hypothetical protein
MKKEEEIEREEEKIKRGPINLVPLKVTLISSLLTGVFILIVSLFYNSLGAKTYIQIFSSLIILFSLFGYKKFLKGNNKVIPSSSKI